MSCNLLANEMSLQNNNLQKLMIVCQQMVQKGTSPSVALLRAKAPFKASVTEAIEAIKHFNAANGASDPASINGKDVETIVSLSKRVAVLEQQMTMLQQRLEASIK
ncbi:hypothetical protein [Alteromonas stellipolaris]|nr:hypothetical protein [Alteromonas stellipolaris]MBZ2161688.1 hypothetical protein [Alteromonas stellipolaris]